MNTFVKADWLALLARLNIDTSQHQACILQTWQKLEKAHQQPLRYYHNQTHILACLAWVTSIEKQPEACLYQADWLRLAFYFHDAVYNPKKDDNEAQSAKWAKAFLTEVNASSELINWVYHAILCTKTHDLSHVDNALNHTLNMDTKNKSVNNKNANEDIAYFLDIDLSILASKQHVYKSYAEAIRKEYQHIPQSTYKKGRKAVLASFLKHEHIYHSGFFKCKYETLARQNIAWEMAQLSMI